MHSVFLKTSARKELAALQKKFQRQVADAIKAIAENPIHPAVRKLKSGEGYRARSGDYRILYTVDSEKVTIYAIGHRKDVYR